MTDLRDAVAPVVLIQALQIVHGQFPGAKVMRNSVGNLAIVGDDGSYLGYVDLTDGDVVQADGTSSRGANA